MAVGKQKESETYVDIGGYVHQDEGRVKAKLYVGDPNRPLVIDDAALTKRLKKVRVTMHVSEDTSVHKNQVYEKDINMDQQILEEGSPSKGGTSSMGKEYLTPEDGNGKNPDGLTPLQVLKNFVDNIAKDNRVQWILIVAIAIIAVAGLFLGA
jgi:hypothetical protein